MVRRKQMEVRSKCGTKRNDGTAAAEYNAARQRRMAEIKSLARPKRRERKRQRKRPEILALEHESRNLGHSSNPVCGFSVMEHVRLCALWSTDNWHGSSLNKIQGWTTVRESYSRALEQGSLKEAVQSVALFALQCGSSNCDV